jgi:hypothetical protein
VKRVLEEEAHQRIAEELKGSQENGDEGKQVQCKESMNTVNKVHNVDLGSDTFINCDLRFFNLQYLVD